MTDPFNNIPEGTRLAVDLLSLATLLGSLVNLLPAVAAVLTIIWTAIRIYETDTVQRLLGKEKEPPQ